MMRVLIDEDAAVQFLEPLRQLLLGHHVDHVTTINWASKKDRNLLADARKATILLVSDVRARTA
jgi:hypothetical protein